MLLLTAGTAYVTYIYPTDNMLTIPTWFLYSLGIFLNLYYAYFESALRGIGSLVSVNKASILSVIIQIAVCAVLFLLGFGLLSPVIGYVAQGLVFRILCSHYFWHDETIEPHLKPAHIRELKDGKRQKELYSSMSVNAYKDGAVLLSNYLVTQSGTVVCSLFISLEETGFYSLTIQLVNAVASIAAVMANSYHPALQSAFAERDIGREKELIGRSSAGFVFVFFVGAIVISVFVVPLVAMFKSSYSLPTGFLALTLLYYFLWRQQSNFAAYISNTNEVPYALAFVSSSICGVCLSVFLVSIFHLGIWGLVLGQMAAQAAFNNWYWIKYVCVRLDTSYTLLLSEGFASLLKAIARR